MKKIKHVVFTAISMAVLLSTGNAVAGNDKSIKGDLRNNIQLSMSSFITNNTINGTFSLYDNVKGKLLKLKFDNLHSGIVKKSGFYVSCADFVDQDGRKIDIDFLVQPSNNQLITTQAIIHSVSGKKRPYHLENS